MAKREYNNEYGSVTQILGVLRKIQLEIWFKVNTAKFCNEESRRGKLVGTQIHDVIQQYIETGKAKIETEHDDEVTTALKSFMLFRKENPDIVLKRAEIPLTSEQYQFNGTLDCLSDGAVVDWKTSRRKDDDAPKVYPEWKYQVAAYVHLHNEVFKPSTDKAIIVVIAKDKIAYNKYDMEKQEIDDCFTNVFLPCIRIYNYQKGRK